MRRFILFIKSCFKNIIKVFSRKSQSPPFFLKRFILFYFIFFFKRVTEFLGKYSTMLVLVFEYASNFLHERPESIMLDAFRGNLSNESQPVFTRVSEKTSESKRLGRQTRPRIEPGTTRLLVQNVDPLGHWWGKIFDEFSYFFSFFYLTFGRESIVFLSNFQSGDFNKFIHFFRPLESKNHNFNS